MSLFSDIKDFINSKNVGSYIYRSELLHISRSTSVDVYRRRLTLLGFLLPTIVLGVYIKLKDIPEKFNVEDSKSAYKNKRFYLKRKNYVRIKKNK